MPNSSRPRPTSLTPDQWDRARALYLYRTRDANRIAHETGAHVSAVRAAIRNSDWNRRLAERRRKDEAAEEQSAAERAAADRRHDARIVALADAILDVWDTLVRRAAVDAVGCDEKGLKRYMRDLPSPQDAQRMQRTATGRPVAVSPSAAGPSEDKHLSILDRLKASGCRTAPFPGDEAQQPPGGQGPTSPAGDL